jgi:peptide/nickel transport system substrate-binding protein
MLSRRWAGLAGLLGLVLVSGPAAAQKSADTLRVAVTDWWSMLDPYQFPLDEAAVFYTSVYETLVSYDARAQKFVPRLAKSWKRIDERTLEFELRADVSFHNGDRFDADDVVETVKFVLDPNVRLRHKDMIDWVLRVEKLGPYRVRFIAREPNPIDLETIADQFYIYDSKVLATLDAKADYGRVNPVATGPYKVVSLDTQKMVLERFDAYYDKSDRFRAPIRHVVVSNIPDRQTQIAQFITGNVDLIRNVTADTARELAQNPDTRVTPRHNGMFMYVTLDAMGRSDSKVMTDQRVRKAFMMAIDRKELARTVIPGGEIADLPDGICLQGMVGCSSTTHPPTFDPNGAKQLLAAAGYPDGFDLELNVHAPIKEIGEAVAGMVRKVGIRASVRPLPIALYTRLRGEGKFTAFLGFRPTVQPDMGSLFEFFFNGNRDYWNDPLLKQLQKDAAVEFDEEKRTQLFERGIDRVNTMNYILPVADLPMVFLHNKSVRVADDPLTPIDTRVGDFMWAD